MKEREREREGERKRKRERKCEREREERGRDRGRDREKDRERHLFAFVTRAVFGIIMLFFVVMFNLNDVCKQRHRQHVLNGICSIKIGKFLFH